MALNGVPDRDLPNLRKGELVQLIVDLRAENEQLRGYIRRPFKHAQTEAVNDLVQSILNIGTVDTNTPLGHMCLECLGTGPERDQIQHRMDCPRWHS